MEFFNHNNAALCNEAERIVKDLDGVKRWREHILNSVFDKLEAGFMIRTATGHKSVPFKVKDVKGIVDNVVAIDEMMQQH